MNKHLELFKKIFGWAYFGKKRHGVEEEIATTHTDFTYVPKRKHKKRNKNQKGAYGRCHT